MLWVLAILEPNNDIYLYYVSLSLWLSFSSLINGNFRLTKKEEDKVNVIISVWFLYSNQINGNFCFH